MESDEQTADDLENPVPEEGEEGMGPDVAGPVQSAPGAMPPQGGGGLTA